MRRFFEIFKMDMENILKNPVLVNANTVFPILLILIMGFLTSGTYANPTSAYNYYTVTFLIYGMLNGAMTASNSFMERDIKKPNLRIIFSPVGSFPIYFSKILSSALFDMVCHLIVLAVLIPLLHLGINTNIGYFILLMIPIEFAAAALGTLFCCIFKTEEATSTLLSNTISILCFLGGTFFSFDGLGGPMAFVSHLSPVKWITDAFFALLFDGNRAVFLPIFLGGIAVSALLVLGCKICFKTEDYI